MGTRAVSLWALLLSEDSTYIGEVLQPVDRDIPQHYCKPTGALAFHDQQRWADLGKRHAKDATLRWDCPRRTFEKGYQVAPLSKASLLPSPLTPAARSSACTSHCLTTSYS